MNKSSSLTRKLVLAALLTALVGALQLLGASVRFGTFSISLVLIPIVIGAATCGVAVGAWLGFVFGLAVLLSGDAAPFLAVNAFGTIATVLVKGIACGFFAGLTYKALAKKNRFLAVLLAAVVCPVVNTGVFLLGTKLFFMDTITAWAKAGGFENVGSFIIYGLIGGNFLFELLFNLILSPTVVRLLQIKEQH